MKRISTTKLVVASVLFLVLFDNFAFFRDVTEVYSPSWNNIWFLASLAVVNKD
jgi:hypothetical protein